MRPSFRSKQLAVLAISAPLANFTGQVSIYLQNANKISFTFLQVLVPDSSSPNCGTLCQRKPLYGASIAMSQEFLAIGCPLCLTTRGTSGAVYLYRWQSSTNKFQPVRLLQGDISERTNLLISSLSVSPSVHDGSSFGSSLSMYVSNGGTLTLAVSAMHCNYDAFVPTVMSAGAVFIYFAEIVPFQDELAISLFQKQIVSPMLVGSNPPQAEFSLGRSVSISSDGKHLAICGGVEFCQFLYVFRRSGSLHDFTYSSFEDFRVLKESTLYQSFHTASISQDSVGLVGNPFYDEANGNAFISSPVHLGFRASLRDPAAAEINNVNFDFEIRSSWLYFFYGAPNYNATYFY
jgi:hypothetical protein